jgi:hypothetical protein
MTQSGDSITEILLPSVTTMDSIFLSTSNYSKGIFNLKGKSNSLRFPFKYVAKKASAEAKITFSITSDANFEFNQTSLVLKTPILAKKDSTSVK